MQCPVVGFGVSVGSVCLWAVILVFMLLGKSISVAALKWLSQDNCSAISSLLVPGIIASGSVSLCCPVLLAETC